MRFHELLGGRVANALTPSADGDLGAKAEKAFSHRFAEPGAAAGDEDLFAGKQAIDKHVAPSLARLSALAAGSKVMVLRVRASVRLEKSSATLSPRSVPAFPPFPRAPPRSGLATRSAPPALSIRREGSLLRRRPSLY